MSDPYDRIAQGVKHKIFFSVIGLTHVVLSVRHFRSNRKAKTAKMQ